jgi:hypothetical protein
VSPAGFHRNKSNPNQSGVIPSFNLGKSGSRLGAVILIAGLVSALSGVAAAESVVVVNERFPFSQDRFNGCNGENLTFNGILHRRELLLPDGTRKILINVQATAIGELGNAYNVRGYHQITTEPDGSFLQRFRDRLISKGPAPNLHVLLITSGPPETFFFEAICRG